MKLTFSENAELWDACFAALKVLATSQVDVGLTSSASGRSRFLMAIHENGCPVMRIPARPVIQPALADLAETAYGIQLLTTLRQYGRPRYVP